MEVKRDGKLTIVYTILAKVRCPAPWMCIFSPGGAEQRDSDADWLFAFASGVLTNSQGLFLSLLH